MKNNIFLILFLLIPGFIFSQKTDTIFYESGKVKIIRNFTENPEVVYGKFYAENGRVVIAEGKYLNKERDSIWVFYDDTGTKNSSETYLKGKKEGVSHVYYPNGKIGETIEWKDNAKNGVWKQFFFDGVLKTDANYVNDNLNGEIKFFHPNSKLHTQGYYKDGSRDGLWQYYDEDGNLIKEEKYSNGFIVD